MMTTCDSGGAVFLFSKAVLSLMSAAAVWFVKSFYFLIFFPDKNIKSSKNPHRSVTTSRACPASSTGKLFCEKRKEKENLNTSMKKNVKTVH